jgi:hypothetical protein
LKKIAPDKWKHFFVGIAMGIVVLGFLWWLLPAHTTAAVVLTLIIVIAISYGFELYSKFTGHGHYEVMDAIAAILGGLVGMGITWAAVLFF